MNERIETCHFCRDDPNSFRFIFCQGCILVEALELSPVTGKKREKEDPIEKIPGNRAVLSRGIDTSSPLFITDYYYYYEVLRAPYYCLTYLPFHHAVDKINFEVEKNSFSVATLIDPVK